MKYIKTFEKHINLPEDGDYILMNTYGTYDVKNFITSSIGRVVSVYPDDVVDYKIRVKYENIPDNIELFFKDGTRIFDIELLIAYGKTEEELKIKIEANKFNI